MEIKLNSTVQDAFLSEAKAEQTFVVIYTINGFQIRGVIVDFDELAILVDSGVKKQMVYKHAVSTIAPFQESKNKDSGYDYRFH